MEKVLYLGIDVSKSKLDLAATIDGDEILSTKSFSNNTTDFANILSWIKHFKIKNIHVCIESTSIYHEDISEFLQSKTTFTVSIVNPAQTKYFSKSLLIRSKTDKTDASMLAKYAAKHKPKKSLPVSAEIKGLRTLTRYLDTLLVDKTREQTRLKSVKDAQLKILLQQKMDFIEKQINEVHSLIENFLNQNSTLKAKIDLLDSIEGIGQKTACILMSEMITCEKVSTKAQIAHAGLDPSRNESGSSVKGKAKISNTGNARLRRCLYMPAVSCVSRNGYFRSFYDNLIKRGKPKKVALTAVMKKMLATASGVLISEQPFNKNWVAENFREKIKIA